MPYHKKGKKKKSKMGRKKRKKAPAGFHYIPDGKLMKNGTHRKKKNARKQKEKIIKEIWFEGCQ